MKEKYFVVSFSGGKDSTAMLLRLMELKEPIDEVIFCDTYMEFPSMYEHIEKVKQIVEKEGIKFTTLKAEKDFNFWFYEYNPKRRNQEAFEEKFGKASGLSWASSRVRWCTRKLKVDVLTKYFKELKEKYEVIQYVGLACDETKRLDKEINKAKNHLHPLVDWKWTEEDCLNYCYSLGFDWDGLYKQFSRVSCWCCPLKKLDEYRALKEFYPSLWQQLIDMDENTWNRFRVDYSVKELDKRFDFEKQRLSDGKSIRNREFFNELKVILGRDDNATN